MAPNRNNVPALIESLSNSDLQSLVQPNFVPLTDAKQQLNQQQQQQQQQEEQNNLSEEQSAGYWDWSSEEQAESIDVLSLSNIESNLIQASSVSQSEQIAEHDDYWAEDNKAENVTEQQEVTTKAQHVMEDTSASYWDWETDMEPKKTMLEKILFEEKARQDVLSSLNNIKTTTTGADIVQVHAQKVANDGYWTWESPVKPSHTVDSSHPNNRYWDWESEDVLEDKASSFLEILKQYERVRVMLSAEHLESQLKTSNVSREHGVDSTTNDENNDEYWQWSEGLGDKYWDAPLREVAVDSPSSYWDW